MTDVLRGVWDVRREARRRLEEEKARWPESDAARLIREREEKTKRRALAVIAAGHLRRLAREGPRGVALVCSLAATAARMTLAAVWDAVAETVRAWRANKKHVAPPAALTVAGVCSLLRAYPNLESVSLRRCAKKHGCLRDVSDVFRVLRAAASGPAARTLRSIDLEGCDVADADVVALLETFATFPGPEGAAEYPISELKLGKCARVTDKALAALAAHPAGRALRSVSVAGTAVTAAGAKAALGGGAAGGFPLLERFDFSGCLDAKGAVALPPR